MNSRLNCSSNGLPTTWTYNGKNYSKKKKTRIRKKSREVKKETIHKKMETVNNKI